MIELGVWSVSAFALSWICADSKISYPLRELLSTKGSAARWLLALLECPACFSFWIGLFGALARVSPIAQWWVSALFTCGTSLLLAKAVGLLDEQK